MPLFNHLIRPLQERLRDRQADRLRGLEVDHQLELGGLLNREIGGLSALENFNYICPQMVGGIDRARTVRRAKAALSAARPQMRPVDRPQELRSLRRETTTAPVAQGGTGSHLVSASHQFTSEGGVSLRARVAVVDSVGLENWSRWESWEFR